MVDPVIQVANEEPGRRVSDADDELYSYYQLLGDLSRALADHRRARGLTQAELAAKLGISRALLSKYEQGASDIGIGRLNHICHQLGLRLRMRLESAKQCALTDAMERMEKSYPMHAAIWDYPLEDTGSSPLFSMKNSLLDIEQMEGIDMDGNELTPFQMNHFAVREFVVKEPDKLGELSDVRVRYKALAAYTRDSENRKWAAVLMLTFLLTDEEGGQDDFLMRMTARGIFSCPGDALTEDQFVEALKTDGAAALIPIMRGQMAAASASLGVPQRATIPGISVPHLDQWVVTKVEAERVSVGSQ